MRLSNILLLPMIFVLVSAILVGCYDPHDGTQKVVSVDKPKTKIIRLDECQKDNAAENCDGSLDDNSGPGDNENSTCKYNEPRCCEWDDRHKKCLTQVSGCHECP